MKQGKGFITLDEIAITNDGYKVNPPNKNKWKTEYQQRMQSLYGSRKFILITSLLFVDSNVMVITLKEDKNGEWVVVGRRTVNEKNESNINKAIKSLQRKAGCRLYYVLLISTDGEYL